MPDEPSFDAYMAARLEESRRNLARIQAAAEPEIARKVIADNEARIAKLRAAGSPPIRKPFKEAAE